MKKINIKKIFYYSIIVIIFLIAFYLRLKTAIIRPIIFDEAFTITYLIKFNNILDIIHADPSVPPLHYLLIKLMSKISTVALWLRFPSLIFSMFGLLMAYKLSIKISNARTALLVLIMLSFSIFQLVYAWQAYVYSQLFFLGMLAFYFFFNLSFNTNVKYPILQAFMVFFCSTLAFFTHYGFIWTIIAFFLILFKKIINVNFDFQKINKNSQKLILAIFGVFICLLFYTPIFVENFERAANNISWFKNINFYSIGESIGNQFGFYDSFEWNSILTSNLSKSFFIFILLIIILYLYKLKDEKLNVLISVSIINLLFPIFFSLVLGQSIHADRAIIITSFTVTALFAVFVNKILNEKLYYLFVTLFSIFFVFSMQKINRNFYYINQEQDASKYYVDWLKQNKNSIDEKKAILIYHKNRIFQKNQYIKRLDYFVLNYYWEGYDGKPPLYNCSKIEDIEEINETNFYVFPISEVESNEINALCNNSTSLVISKPKKEHVNFLSIDYEDSLNIVFYECN